MPHVHVYGVEFESYTDKKEKIKQVCIAIEAAENVPYGLLFTKLIGTCKKHWGKPVKARYYGVKDAALLDLVDVPTILVYAEECEKVLKQ